MKPNAETTTKLVAVLKSVVDRLESVENDLASLREMRVDEPSPPSEEMSAKAEFDELSAKQTDDERLAIALRAMADKLGGTIVVDDGVEKARIPIPPKGGLEALDWAPLPARPKKLASWTKSKRKGWWDTRNALLRAFVAEVRATPSALIGLRGKPVLNLPNPLKERIGKKFACGAKNVGMREAEVRKAT